jgi:glycosyltransferase involved in cell wall biosynthesis
MTPLAVLLVGDYPPDPTLGSSKVLVKLQQELTQLGHRCDVVFRDGIGGPAGRQVRQLVSPWYAGSAIARRLRERHYDVVDAASAEGLWFALRNVFARRRTAYVCRSNGLEHLDYRRMLGDDAAGLIAKPWVRRVWYPASRLTQVAAAARLADRLLLLNEADRRFALERGWQPADRIDVVPHGVSDVFLSAPPADGQRGRGLLFCGSWAHVKGVHELVGAFERLHAGGEGPRLTVLGPGVPVEVVLSAFRAELRGCVSVIPRAPEPDVIRAYREHDVLLWPSTYEGFGLVLLEAMSQGMAVVATPVGCASSIVRNGENGILIPLRDADALARAARTLLGDAALRERLGRAARASVAGMSWRRTAELTEETYRRALRATKAHAA